MAKGKYRFKIAYKIFIFTILVSIIPMFFLSTLFYNRMVQVVKNEMIASYEHAAQQYVSNVEYKLGLYENIMGEISSNKLVQDFLLFLQQADDPREISKVRATVLEDINRYLSDKWISNLNRITLYPLGNKTIMYHSHISDIKNIDNYERIEIVLNYGNTNLFYSYKDWAHRDVISFYNVVTDSSKYASKNRDNRIGLIRLDTYATDLFALTKVTNAQDNIKLIILDKDMNRFYGIDGPDVWDRGAEGIIQALYNGEKYVKINDEKYLITKKEISKYGWSTILLLEYSEINKKIYEGTAFILIVNLIVYVILFVVCIMFSSSMSNRLKILIDKMHKVKLGILVNKPRVKGNDEIALIDSHFNDMVVQLNDLIKESYIRNLEKKEAELKALRFQINPHFLYNTLELINSMASVYDCDEIGMISQKLGQMFRYNITDLDSDFTTLREEIDHIQNYYSIEKIRFEDNVKVVIDVPDELLGYRIPRFILQPLVENAFRYGFGGDKLQGTIRINADIMGEHLYIFVEDDGDGMVQERLEFLRSYINDEETKMIEYLDDKNTRKGIGLHNVNKRIELCYGDNYGIQLESEKGKGTKVIIRIPNV